MIKKKSYYTLKEGVLSRIIGDAVKKAGSERKLAKELNMSKGSIYCLKFEKRNISEEYLNKLKDYLRIGVTDFKIMSILSSNWGQKIGGINSVRKKIKDGTFKKNMIIMHKSSSKNMKNWHKTMKENNPKNYHKWQYERFKKIGRGYTCTLINGVKVRNQLEKKVGDFLVHEFEGTKYEEYINIKNRAYFPDFIYKNIIIEVTEWKHPSEEKIKRLTQKYKDYTHKNYQIIFFIPKEYRKFYKEIENSIVSTLTELKDRIKALIAQSKITEK